MTGNPPVRVSLGLDFGTDSVRAVLIGLDGTEHGAAVDEYEHGQIVTRLPGSNAPTLPDQYALQHPSDWLASAGRAVGAALQAARLEPEAVIGIGVDFTSCTMLPCRRGGQPLCLEDRFAKRPHAWPKLWKHHGAGRQTDDLNRAARERAEPWLARYGGIIGLEMLFPKMLEIFDDDREVFEAAAMFIEGGDWLVGKLIESDGGGGEDDAAGRPLRSTCQAGYKALWSPDDGYPSRDYLDAVRPGFGDSVLARLPGRHLAPGARAGVLSRKAAAWLGLRRGVPVSMAIIDAHAGVPGAGAGGPDTLVMVMGTSTCHMLCSTRDVSIPGVAGIVRDGILCGYIGYEMGQAAVGDAFAWLQRVTGRPLADLANEAAALPPGAGGVHCVDWFNGCRTPLMNGSLTGSFHGLTLSTTPAHLYRAMLEGTAYGMRWIVELLREAGMPIRRFVATGGLPHAHPIIIQTCADVLGEAISIHPALHGPATGAAIFGAVAAGRAASGFDTVGDAVSAMALPAAPPIIPDALRHERHERGYRRYRELTSAAAASSTARLTSG